MQFPNNNYFVKIPVMNSKSILDARVRSGKIAIQSEGADIYYRKIDLKVL